MGTTGKVNVVHQRRCMCGYNREGECGTSEKVYVRAQQRN